MTMAGDAVLGRPGALPVLTGPTVPLTRPLTVCTTGHAVPASATACSGRACLYNSPCKLLLHVIGQSRGPLITLIKVHVSSVEHLQNTNYIREMFIETYLTLLALTLI